MQIQPGWTPARRNEASKAYGDFQKRIMTLPGRFNPSKTSPTNNAPVIGNAPNGRPVTGAYSRQPGNQTTAAPDMSAYSPGRAQPQQPSQGTPYGQPATLAPVLQPPGKPLKGPGTAQPKTTSQGSPYGQPAAPPAPPPSPQASQNQSSGMRLGAPGMPREPSYSYPNDDRPVADMFHEQMLAGAMPPMLYRQPAAPPPSQPSPAMPQPAPQPSFDWRSYFNQTPMVRESYEERFAPAPPPPAPEPPKFTSEFTQSMTGFGGQQSDPSQFYAQRDAFIQRLNDERGRQAAQAGVYGPGETPRFYQPSRDFGALWGQAGDMASNGWTNPLAGLFG
jgi:hypothetical protein